MADVDTDRGVVDVLEEQLAHGGRAPREARDHCIDGIVAQLSKKARFPIVECPSRIGAIEHPFELTVGVGPIASSTGEANAFRGHRFFAGF